MRQFSNALLLSGALMLALALLSGCSGSLEASRPPRATIGAASQSRCEALDDAHTAWGGVSKTSAVLAGGSGLATIPADDQGLRIGLAVGAAVSAAVAAGAGFISDAKAESWARDCAGQ
jgi:hypothetical protein